MPAKKVKSKNSKSETDTPLIKSANLFPVVGIGASAGGLDAFKKLLKAIPEDSGMAYVLVQHLDPSHESMLPEILQKVTTIPVLEVADDIKVVPDHIYIIPSNKMLISNDGVLELSPRPDKNKMERNLPIDLFFTSLAEVHQSHAIGVVLSGTASDGTLGLKAIKDHGGITFAQDEESAQYEGMPNSAVQAGVVDFILPPEKIPQKLLEVNRIINGNGVGNKALPPKDEDVYKHIISLLRLRKGTDFSYYKQTTIRRRILRRMALNKNGEPADYLKYLRENKNEQDVLYQDLLIPVTTFFRDPKVFENLCESVFPLMVKNKTAGEPIRVWVAGCSTGEEVYSIAMCLREFLGYSSSSSFGERVQIFATDISEPAIAKARAGIYKKNEVATISPQRLQEFFTKINGSYQVNKLVRDMCVFAVHNFLKDPPFGKIDFISCRNVLIYMEPYLQKKALSTFHYALNLHGFLLLGKSETTSGVPDLFASVNKIDKLFSRKDVPGKYIHIATQRSEKGFADINTSSKGENIRTDFQKTADEILLSKYTPAGVVVNDAMDIVHFRGSTGNFLEPSPGKASFNLMKMAKNGLAFELRNILHKAKKDNTPVLKENISLPVTNHHGAVVSQRMISIEAIPLPNIVEPHYLILFHDYNPAGEQLTGIRQPKTKNPAKVKKDNKEIRTQQLEKELSQIREDMRSITEEQEAANEELQSANEELLSSSEEMQSLNEEMETSKEELQSSNEELMVVNQEMVNLNEQVTAARDYAEAIILTIREPLLVLDKNLRIKSANNSFYKTFQVVESEIEDRLLIELNNKQWNIPELLTLLEEVLPQKIKIVDFEVTLTMVNNYKRIMLLNAREILTEKKEKNLILLAIEDITERKGASIKIEESEKRKAFLLQLSDALRLPGDTRQIKTNAMQVLGQYLKVSRCYYADVSEDGKYCFIDNSFSPGLDTIDGTYRLKDFGKAKVAMLQRGEVILTADVANDTSVTQEEKNRNLEMQIHAFIIVPLIKDNKLICLFGVNQSEVRNWTELDLSIVKETAERTCAAIERAKVEEALRSSEEKFRILFTSIDQGFALCEVIRNKESKVIDMCIREVNPTYEKQTGINKEIVLDKPLLQIFPSLHTLLETYAGVVDNQCPAVFEDYFEETERWFAVNAYPIDKDKFSVLFSDITKRKLAEEEIKETHERFRLLVKELPAAVYSCDVQGYIIFYNDAAAKLWGRKPEIGKDRWCGATNLFKPDGSPLPIEQCPMAITIREGRSIASEELIIERPDGSRSHVLVNPHPEFGLNGELTGAINMLFDISEQVKAKNIIEESEKRFRQMAELLPQKVWTSDAKGHKNYFNKTLLDYAGMSSKELEGEGWQKIMHPEDWENNKKQWEESLRTGKTYQTENRLLRKDGKYLWHITQAVPVKDINGKIEMWVGAKTEIDSMKTEEIRKGDFIKMVSHELKTPVTSIKGYVQLLLMMTEDLHSEQNPFIVKDSLIRIDRQIIKLTRLIAEMLDLTRIEGNRLELQTEVFNLNTLVSESIEDIRYTNTSHVIKLIQDDNCMVNADKDRIEQVIINLIANAIKYSADLGKIEVRIHKVQNNQVGVSIKDYGIGIDLADHKKIFERFYRVHGKSEQTFPGFGIGLFIANEIIERHNGFIKIESEKDKGAIFTFTLPIAPEDNK